MNRPSKDIGKLLDGQTALGLTIGTDLFTIIMPDSPADCVVVYDNPGDPPMLTMQQNTSNYFYSSISVWVRNTDYDSGWNLMQAISEFLHGRSQDVINGTYYALIRAESDPQLLHWDENRRAVFIVNFEVQRKSNS